MTFVKTLRGIVTLAAAVCACSSLTWQAPSAHAAPQTYAYTGGPQIYVVPPGITSIDVTLSGAQGASPSGGGTGGLGGSVSASISVTPGEVLQVMVGGSGGAASGGFNGGGRGAGTGGGASDIRRPAFSTSSSCAYNLTCSAAQRIIVAGGGGGGGNFAGANGGAGGSSAIAGSAGGVGDATGGGAGTGASGGSAGSGTYTSAGAGAAAGSAGAGGTSAWVAGATGGGGGGGYFGGGGGGVSQDGGGTPQADGSGGGGGGSSWAGGAGVSSPILTDAVRPGDGVITIDPPSAITNAAFGLTGQPQYFVVASDVTQLAIRLYGAGGRGSNGDIVYGSLPVTGGETLQVNIGGQGQGYTQGASGWTGGSGGWNGGGEGARGAFANDGGGGGGATDMRRCVGVPTTPCGVLDRLVVSAGGGGSGHASWGCYAGTGGSSSTGAGSDGACGTFGSGGSLTAGGAAGVGSAGAGGRGATAGILGIGGEAGSTGSLAWGGAGGGGGGYFGGGGGFDSGGGGGGSSYASVTGSDATGQGLGNVLGSANAPIQHNQGGNGGDGMAVITAMPIGVTTAATGPTQTSVDISGSVNPKFLATTPTVQYSTSQATVTAGSGTSVNLTGPNSASVLAGDEVQAVSGSLAGLSANTTYYYRVCAQSVAGNGCGAIDSFTTLPVGFTAPTLGAISATASSSTMATTSLTITPGTGPAVVTFQCSTSPIFASIFATSTAPESPMSGGSSQTATGSCSGLSASTTYYVRAVVTITVNSNTYTYVSSSTTVTTTAAPNPSPTPSGGGGSSSSASPTPTPTPSQSSSASTPTLPPLTPVAPSAPVRVTGPVVLVNGQLQEVTVKTTDKDTALEISGDGFTMNLQGVSSAGRPLGLTPDGALILETDRFARTTGTGFMADTPVKLFLFSEPLYVGDVLTNDRGAFDGSVQIPLSIRAGRHTLQANGYTPDGSVRSLSLPVLVTQSNDASRPVRLQKKVVVTFAPFSAHLDAQARKELRRLVAKVGPRAKTALVMGYVQGTSYTANDLQLSAQRARAVADFMRAQGFRGRVVHRGEGVSDLPGAGGRRVVATISYTK